MKRLILSALFALAFSGLFAEANYVYHETTTNTIGCGGVQFRTNLNPYPNQAISIGYKVEFQNYTNQLRVYYTTDGSTPGGSFGAPSGTTQVVSGSYTCTFVYLGNTIDVCQATIPAQAGGTTVKYIVSAYHSVAGAEIFANGPGSPCGCGTPTNNSSLATVFQYTVLPIELVRFEAQKEERFTRLDWQTATETNNRAFQIERSANSADWETLDQVAGAGNSFTEKNYSWTDGEPLEGVSYYRLRQVDFDGKSSLSPVVKVERGGEVVFTVFPNPTVSSTTVKTFSSTEGEALIDLIGESGRWIGTVHFQLQTGENVLELPLTGLPGGWYTLRYRGPNGRFVEKVFIKPE